MFKKEMFKKEIRMPILALVLLSLGGFLLHTRIHPPTEEPINLIPFIVGLFTTLILPFMFNFQKTYFAAYGINLLVVLVGTIGMAYYSATHWKPEIPITASNIILQTTLADIIILLARLPLAQIIMRHFEPEKNPTA